MVQNPSKYTPEILAYIQENAGIVSPKDMAAHIGVSHVAMNRQVTAWRRQGKKIKSLKMGNASEGDIRVRTRSKSGYQEQLIKVGEDWVQLRRYNYEQAYGPIPEGHKVYCKDGDSLNCDPTNLCIKPHKTEKPEKKPKIPKLTKRATRGTTSQKKKPGTEANWTQKHLVEPKEMKIPPAPMGQGVKIDNRTWVYPKDANISIEELTKRFSKNVDTIKNSLTSGLSHATH